MVLSVWFVGFAVLTGGFLSVFVLTLVSEDKGKENFPAAAGPFDRE